MKDQGTATREITLGSLFDGAGGFPLAGTLAGITPKWASEIEPFPIRVTTKRFPDMKHIGNITEVSGADIEPVDIITFGSPCQDLSVANCGRKGLQGAGNQTLVLWKDSQCSLLFSHLPKTAFQKGWYGKGW